MKGLSSDYMDLLESYATRRDFVKRLREVLYLYESYAMFYEAMAAAVGEVIKVVNEEIVHDEELN